MTVLASGVEGRWFEHAWLADLIAMLAGEDTSGTSTGWFEALAELARPEVVYIAAINGDCGGGGAELGWACDLRVAEEQVYFSQPEVQINLATVTAEMVLDGAPLPAKRIYELGGVNRVVPTGEARGHAIAWAKRLATRPPEALRVLKQMLLDAQNLPLDDAMQNEQRLFQGIAATPEAMEKMREVQGRFDRGETPRGVYGEPR